MAMALRPRPSASTIRSRYASQALACGARPGRSSDAEAASPATVSAAGVGEGSVDTSDEMAGFAGRAGGRPPASHHHARGLQVAAGRLAPDPGRSLDASQRPPEASQRQDLLSFFFAQDVAHAGQERAVPAPRQRLGPLSENGRFSDVH